MRIVSTTGAHEVTHLGKTYSAVDDGGIFDVPEQVGLDLTSFPHFVPEHVALANEAQARAEHDREPGRTGERVRVLESEVAALKERLAAIEGDDEPSDGETETKTRRSRKPKTDEATA